MTTFPAAGDISNQKSVDLQKALYEDQLQAIKELIGGEFEVLDAPGGTTLTVTKSVVELAGPGWITGPGGHTIAQLNTSELVTGRALCLIYHNVAGLEAMFSSVGNLQPRTSVITGLPLRIKQGEAVLWFRMITGEWIEIASLQYDPTEQGGFADWLQLGDAAYEDQGPGNGLDADTLDGIEAAGFLPVAGQAADSLALVGVAGANYARKDSAAEQTFTGALNAAVTSKVEHPNGSVDFGFEHFVNGIKRGSVALATNMADMLFTVWDTAGTAIISQLQLHAAAGQMEFHNGSAIVGLTWEESGDLVLPAPTTPMVVDWAHPWPGNVPSQVDGYIRCTGAQLGWVTGDHIPIQSLVNQHSSNNPVNCLYYNDTNVGVRWEGPSGASIPRKTNAAGVSVEGVNRAQWVLRLRAKR